MIKKKGSRGFLLLIFFLSINLYAQQYPGGRDDSLPALQYALYVQEFINEGKWSEAFAAVRRAGDFANASSDISYQSALCRLNANDSLNAVIFDLDSAIQTNRWTIHNENSALMLKAQTLIILRDYYGAVSCLNIIGSHAESNAQIRADAEMMRLTALRGIALGAGGNPQTLAVFRSGVLNAMDRYPRDPRPLRIFFEYAASSVMGANRLPQISSLPDSDINLLDLAIRRLPFLLDTDPDLAWMAAPFMRDTDAARRTLSSYRSGGLSSQLGFIPNPASIPPALNLGLISDRAAIEELFMLRSNQELTLDKKILTDTYDMLRSEEGRDLFTLRLLSFTGYIITDEERDGYAENSAYYRNGLIVHSTHYFIQDNVTDMYMDYGLNYDPQKFTVPVLGQTQTRAEIIWERYPSIIQARFGNETFNFGPANFQYAPVSLIELGGSNSFNSILFPVISNRYVDITYRTLVSFCSTLTRPSLEFDGAMETIFLSGGVIQYVTEEINGMQISVTEFDRGLPSVQYIDIDLDGRMETIRRFRRPPSDYVWQDLFDYRRLLASSESDFRGDGRFKTMEVYQLDGSIVYYYDLDGSGTMNYSEIRN